MRVFFCLLVLVWSCHSSKGSSAGKSLATVAVPETGDDVPFDPDARMIRDLMTLVNDHRISIGLRPLDHVDGLREIAEGHSRNMASGSVSFGHSGFSIRCSQGRTVLGGGNLCSENVARGQKTVEAAFQSWMNSSGHKANLEQPRSTHTGFGFARSSSGVWYWTQIFLEKN